MGNLEIVTSSAAPSTLNAEAREFIPNNSVHHCNNIKADNSQNTLLCTLCGGNDTPDEFHFLFICPKFIAQRKKYMKSYYYTRPSTFKMQELFNSKDENILANLAKLAREIILFFKTPRR